MNYVFSEQMEGDFLRVELSKQRLIWWSEPRIMMSAILGGKLKKYFIVLHTQQATSTEKAISSNSVENFFP